jgi:outer membrane protein assembly factor BamB
MKPELILLSARPDSLVRLLPAKITSYAHSDDPLGLKGKKWRRLLLYNARGIMLKSKAFGIAAMLGLAFASCAVPRKGPLVDPSAVRFPLAEAGTLEIEGTVVGQPRARDGVVYFATREGFLTAVVVPARQVFWRFKAEHAVSVSPELGENHILLRDEGNLLYAVGFKGSLVLKKQLNEAVTSAVRECKGQVYFGTANGKVMALDLSGGGGKLWEVAAAASDTAVTAGPVFFGDLIIFGAADGKLVALDRSGKLIWVFAAKGTIAADPAVADGRLYFGTENRFFYCLNAATGKKRWARRIQGAPLFPVLVHGRRLVVPASNSVIYFISRRGGSILSWEAVPSRIVHEPALAGPLVLITSQGPRLVSYDITTGKRLGEHLTPGPLGTGALWVSPFIVLVVEDSDSGRQTFIFLGPAAAIEKPR